MCGARPSVLLVLGLVACVSTSAVPGPPTTPTKSVRPESEAERGQAQAPPSWGQGQPSTDGEGLGRAEGSERSDAYRSGADAVVPAREPSPGSPRGGHPAIRLGDVPDPSDLAETTLDTIEVNPEDQRSLVVGFARHEGAPGVLPPLVALSDCLGRGGRTPGGSAEFSYRTGTRAAVEQVSLTDCSYPQSDICACMQAVVDRWQLPASARHVKVSIRVQTSAGELPPEGASGVHAWDTDEDD